MTCSTCACCIKLVACICSRASLAITYHCIRTRDLLGNSKALLSMGNLHFSRIRRLAFHAPYHR